MYLYMYLSYTKYSLVYYHVAYIALGIPVWVIFPCVYNMCIHVLLLSIYCLGTTGVGYTYICILLPLGMCMYT